MTKFELALHQSQWVDLVSPSKEELEHIAAEFKISRKLVFNCLDPEYLPHIQTYNNVNFLLLRYMEPEFNIKADTVQDLTTKIALFICENKIVSIHRLPLHEVEEVKKKILSLPENDRSTQRLVSLFFEMASLGFNSPLVQLENKLEKFEEKVFQNSKSHSLLLEGYYIKRKASAFKKVIKLTLDTLNKTSSKLLIDLPLLQECKDLLERNLFYAEEVFENIQSLLNLHMTIESQKTNEASFKTNEIMRVLTVLSIFFLPLNFLAGLFGMNFEYIPLLKNPMGFWASIILMFIICLALAFYVLKKGWLADKKDSDLNS